ncbi:hypothetical protein B0H19DRAFT_1081026 [Mycena capillaripes]|nr:hypothetical protein B0H19DRAFT_1081026 [Mycena capillaripes]
MSRLFGRQPKCHSSALSQQDQNSSGVADICELHMKKGTRQSMLHETQRARAQGPDRTLVERVDRLKEGWGDVRASTVKRGTATQDLRVGPRKATPLPRREMPARKKEKTGKARHSPMKYLRTFAAVCGPGRREQRSRREGTGGTVVLEGRPRIVILVLRPGVRPLDARRGREWRKGRCWREVVEGRSSRKEYGPPRVEIETEEKKEGEQKERARRSERVDEKERGEGASIKEMQSAMGGKYVCAEEQRGEGREGDEDQYYEGRCEPCSGDGRTVLARMKRQDYLLVGKKTEVAHAKDAMEEKRMGGS